jgi:hypothetical protein
VATAGITTTAKAAAELGVAAAAASAKTKAVKMVKTAKPLQRTSHMASYLQFAFTS